MEHKANISSSEGREITLTIGIFFDGTGNNATNLINNLNYFSAKGHYTNIYKLFTLYATSFTADEDLGQLPIYIEGIGTEDGVSDNIYGMSSGMGNTGVIRKTDKAIAAMITSIKNYLAKPSQSNVCTVKELQYDIFGFSRGAAAARHFANRVFSRDETIVSAIKAGLGEVKFCGTPSGRTRFLGLFDTVAAIGTPINGLNPHSAYTGKVKLELRPGVAEKVFHITAQHECRYNFALNSVKPAWPELALPGVHSDIGGGYSPYEHEVNFLTRPQFETVSFDTPDTKTRIYKQAGEELKAMNAYPAIAPILKSARVNIETWHDARIPPDRYGSLQKRSGAAVVIDRIIYNDWSIISLEVMLDAAQDAGVVFNSMLPEDNNFSIHVELNCLREKAIMMGRDIRSGKSPMGFTSSEINMLAKKYIHCSANWNHVVRDKEANIKSAVKPLKLLTFINRPDDRWQRTVYDMVGNKIWK